MPKNSRPSHHAITLSEALDSQQNVLSRLRWPKDQEFFYKYLKENCQRIRSIVSQTLGVSRSQCTVSTATDQWLRGSFNVCIPVGVDNWEKSAQKIFVFRVPLPYKIGEAYKSGNVDEKLRTEAGTYAWVTQHCPEVPVARMWGFGLMDGNLFGISDAQRFYRKSLFMRPFAANTRSKAPVYRRMPNDEVKELGTGFMLLDFVGDSHIEVLSRTWKKHYQDKAKRATFFKDLSRIMLSLAKTPHKEIASLCFNDDCTVTLSNRPMTSHLSQMENEGIPIPIRRNDTYNHCSAYVSDLLRCQDSWLHHAPNAVSDAEDALFQTSVIAGMRAIQPTFIPNNSLRGPFYMTLTDLHASNIFVDQDWNIKCVIDLEWSGTRPLEMIHPPDWMCGMGNDMVDSLELSSLQAEFIDVLQSEQDRTQLEFQLVSKREPQPQRPSAPPPLAETMRRGAQIGAFWYFSAVKAHGLATFIWTDYLMDRYFTHESFDSEDSNITQEPHDASLLTETSNDGAIADVDDSAEKRNNARLRAFVDVISNLWQQDRDSFIDKKLKDRSRYVEEIRSVFSSNNEVEIEKQWL